MNESLVHKIFDGLQSPANVLGEFAKARGISFEGGAAIDKKLMLFTLTIMTNAKLVYETGFNVGGSACSFAEALKQTGGKYVGFEIAERRRPVFEEFLRRYPGHEIVMGDSASTLPQRWEATHEQPDVFFVDGDHRAQAAIGDIKHALNIVRPGGMIMIDDVAHPPVRAAVDEILEEDRIIWFNDPDYHGPGSCIYQKKG